MSIRIHNVRRDGARHNGKVQEATVSAGPLASRLRAGVEGGHFDTGGYAFLWLDQDGKYGVSNKMTNDDDKWTASRSQLFHAIRTDDGRSTEAMSFEPAKVPAIIEALEQFDGEATVHGILGGVASVEELRIPSRNFSGMGLRLLDVERKLWADYWVTGQGGVLSPPPTWGSFTQGAGTWDAEEVDGGKPVIVRGVWDQMTPTSCRWYQAVSRDDGKSWQENWIMHWTRV